MHARRVLPESKSSLDCRVNFITRQMLCAALLAATAVFAAEPPADLQLEKPGDIRAKAWAHFLAARMLEDDGKAREALGHYLSFMTDGGETDAELVAHVADMLLAYQDVKTALDVLQSRIKSVPDSPEPYVNLTLFCLKHADEHQELADRALKTADEGLAKFPKRAEVYANAARLHLVRGEREKAVLILERAAQQKVNDAEFWLGTGRIAQDVWPVAEQEKRPEYLGKINTFYHKARDAALTAKDDDAAIEVADFYLFSNQLPAAAEICESVVKRSGALPARKRLVRLYEAMEKPAESLKALEDLVKAFPDDVEHRKLLASQYIQKRQFDKGVEQLESAMKQGGAGLQDYIQLCELLRMNGDGEKFLRFTRRAAQLFPEEPRVSYLGALAQTQLKQYAEAAQAYERTEKLAQTRLPDLLGYSFYFAHGVALERCEKFDEASKKFQKSIELTPPDDPPRAASAMNYLGFMWADRGEHLDKADELIRKANELQPDIAAYVDSLGWLLFKQGKFSDALRELTRAEQLLKEVEPDDAEILDHLAQTHDKLGQRAMAEKYWKRVLDLKPTNPVLMERAAKALGIVPPKTPSDDPSKVPPQKNLE